MKSFDKFKTELAVGDLVILSTSNLFEFGVVNKVREDSCSICVVDKNAKAYSHEERKYVDIEPYYTAKTKACHYPAYRLIVLNEAMQYGFPDQAYLFKLQQVKQMVLTKVKVPARLN